MKPKTIKIMTISGVLLIVIIVFIVGYKATKKEAPTTGKAPGAASGSTANQANIDQFGAPSMIYELRFSNVPESSWQRISAEKFQEIRELDPPGVQLRIRMA